MGDPPGASTSEPEHRSGFAALVGLPNAGKSTLLNRLLGQKVTIVSPKPQTTRRSIRGIRSTPRGQVIYVDTPGIQAGRDALGRHMRTAAAEAMEGVDVVVWVADAAAPAGSSPASRMRDWLGAGGRPVILALNKIDRLRDKRVLLALLQRASEQHDFRALVPISAATGEGVDRLEAAVLGELSPGPPLYPPETVTDQAETFFVAEAIREKVLLLTHQEVPHAVAVQVEELVEREPSGVLYVRAKICVEASSQRAIVVGAGGARLRAIGQAARRDLEAFFGVRMFLDLWVEVRSGWRRDERALQDFGYLLTDPDGEG